MLHFYHLDPKKILPASSSKIHLRPKNLYPNSSLKMTQNITFLPSLFQKYNLNAIPKMTQKYHIVHPINVQIGQKKCFISGHT